VCFVQLEASAASVCRYAQLVGEILRAVEPGFDEPFLESGTRSPAGCLPMRFDKLNDVAVLLRENFPHDSLVGVFRRCSVGNRRVDSARAQLIQEVPCLLCAALTGKHPAL
jgi:hypothetical protein